MDERDRFIGPPITQRIRAGIPSAFGSLWRALGGRGPVPFTAEEATVVVPLPFGLDFNTFAAGAATVTNQPANTVVVSSTVPRAGFYQLHASAYLMTAVAAAIQVAFQVLDEGAGTKHLIQSSLFGAGDSELFRPLTLYMRPNWVVRVLQITATGVGETVGASITVQELLQM